MFANKRRSQFLGLGFLMLLTLLTGCQSKSLPVTNGKTVYYPGPMTPIRRSTPAAGTAGGVGNPQTGTDGQGSARRGSGNG